MTRPDAIFTTRLRRVAAVAAMAAAGLLHGGCGMPAALQTGPAGQLRVESLGADPVAVSGRLQTSLYTETPVETTFLMADAPLASILDGTIDNGQVLHLELLWLPRPGRTPLAASATNVSIRYVVISNGEIGVYGGAGFAMPQGRIGGRNATITLRDASLKLLEQTDGFVDLLTPATISGTFTARRDERRTRQAHYALSQLVTNAFGRTMFVRLEPMQSWPSERPLRVPF